MKPANHMPVVIIGAGPTGLMLANLLGVAGVETLLVERHATTVDEPRAVSIDDESLRAVQNAGLLDRVLPDIVQGYGVHYHALTGQVFAQIMPASREYGHARRNAFRQPLLEAALLDALARFPQVSVRMRHELIDFAEVNGAIAYTLKHESTTIQGTCDWLVACDGGRSAVREKLGIAMRGATYAERWLIVDLTDRQDAFPHTRTYCDPLRPTIRLPGPHGTLRYEFMLHPSEDADDMLGETRIRAWMHERVATDAQLPIVRKVVYTFHARMAEAWRKDRVFLAGDAAHLSPPFAGQGMNSGIRDACNLAWKLAAVVRGELGPRLLDTYAIERAPHAWALIRMALRIGAFMQPASRFSARLMQGALKLISLYPPARDYVLQLRFKPKPRFTAGFFVPDAAPGDAMRAGQLIVQPPVELQSGEHVRLDDVLGSGFACIGWAAPPGVPAALREVLAGLNVRFVVILRKHQPFLPDALPDGIVVRDCDGVLEHLLNERHAQALLLRPDRYVLAFLRSPGFVDEIARLKALFAQTRTA
jgi:3-(3-hydroxy-phenyl)propionate hydroxylase